MGGDPSAVLRHRRRFHICWLRASHEVVHAVRGRAPAHVDAEVLIQPPGHHAELAGPAGYVCRAHRAEHSGFGVEREHRGVETESATRETLVMLDRPKPHTPLELSLI